MKIYSSNNKKQWFPFLAITFTYQSMLSINFNSVLVDHVYTSYNTIITSETVNYRKSMQNKIVVVKFKCHETNFYLRTRSIEQPK